MTSTPGLLLCPVRSATVGLMSLCNLLAHHSFAVHSLSHSSRRDCQAKLVPAALAHCLLSSCTRNLHTHT